ncbi:MAG: cupin domain-containing protein [Anaerolineales bacterium]
MALTVTNVSAIADKIERPFNVVTLAVVGDLNLSVYLCQGAVNWHKHPDEDELFLIHEGVVGLETERGSLVLHPEELAVVPKGTVHRSGSALRSVVMLIRPTAFTSQRNGHRKLYALESDPPLEKVRLARVGATLSAAYQAAALARVEDFELLLLRAEGFGPTETAPGHGALWFVLRGAVGVEIDQGAGTRLEAGELTVVPRGQQYRLSATQSALLLTLARAGTAD